MVTEPQIYTWYNPPFTNFDNMKGLRFWNRGSGGGGGRGPVDGGGTVTSGPDTTLGDYKY